MMKKKIQPPKGNLKISNFFAKINESNPPNRVTTADNKKTTIAAPDVLLNITNIEGQTNDVLSSSSSPGKRKRTIAGPSDETLSSSNKKVCPDATPPPHFTQRVFVKTPEKLGLIRAPAMRPSTSMQVRTPSPERHKWRVAPQQAATTPDKQSTPGRVKRTPLKGQITPDRSERTTPGKQQQRKATPTKLFERSPKNLDTFNVGIVDSFVKVMRKTPPGILNGAVAATANYYHGKSSGGSNTKKQASILDYVSPVKCSGDVQACNESTPVKSPVGCAPASAAKAMMNSLRVKTKLDFAEGRANNAVAAAAVPAAVETEESLFDDSWGEEFDAIISTPELNLDLTKSQHCKIVSIDRELPKRTTIQVKSTQTNKQARCKIDGFWLDLELRVGDRVHICAQKTDDRIDEWILDNDHGLLVYEPDLLISSTSVVNSLFCKRRSVLSERYKGFEGGNRQMLVGTLVHTLLQTVLKEKLSQQNQIEAVLEKMFSASTTIRKLYECSLTVDDLRAELTTFIPRIVDFVRNYINGGGSNGPADNRGNWRGRIDQIIDIEENIWLPELGIKGKVDVSVRSGLLTMPLELKTGRATVSLEHRGQVILYLMMMQKLGYRISSGLLLYLREGVLKEIPMSSSEKRDIIILRNEFAYFLSKNPKNSTASAATTISTQNTTTIATTTTKFVPPLLPTPINHHNACSKCPFNTICASYLKYSNHDLSTNKSLQIVRDSVTAHLNENHLNYFVKWSTLLALESQAKSGYKEMHEIYTVPPEKRQINGRCITRLKITRSEPDSANALYDHTMISAANNDDDNDNTSSSMNFFASGILENNYVVVSTDQRPAVAAGFIIHIAADSIQLSLDRNLSVKYPAGTLFHLDTYDSSTMQSFNLTSLALLLEDSARANQLRRIIIDRTTVPIFTRKIPHAVAGKARPILRRLNKVQQSAVLRALTTQDYLLIKGMPGTGKTATIVALIQLLVEMDKTVLITSHTHSAVDNVCIQLQAFNVDVLRLGADSKINEVLRGKSERYWTKDCKTPDDLERVYNSAKVLAVTCLGSGHPVLSKRTVDVCIVDESTQVLQSSVLRPIYASKMFILVGDPDQLPPVIRNSDAVDAGMSESLFERLDCTDATIKLTLNYRMNRIITDLANRFTYNGDLLIGNDRVAEATLQIPADHIFDDICKTSPWIGRALDPSIESSFQIIDTGPVWQLSSHMNVTWRLKSFKITEDSCINIYETAIVVKLVKALIKCGVPESDIGVIATFRAQVAQISTLLAVTAKGVIVSTVDQFQGQDKNVIIYSCTKSQDLALCSRNRKYEIMDDKRRLTVAITRAKNKLILIGDLSTIKIYSTTFGKLLSFVDSDKLIKLNEIEGFQWSSELDLSV